MRTNDFALVAHEFVHMLNVLVDWYDASASRGID